MGIKFNKVDHNYPGPTKKDIVVGIKDIELTIKPIGEIIAICGKTGSGKTTLIQHLNALLIPTAGSVNIFDKTILPKNKEKLKPIRKRIGFVFQFPEYQLFEETVLKDVMFAPKNFGQTVEESKKNALQACEKVQIEESLLHRSPINLSGGQMRKVAIAGVLSYNPDILVLDEPTRGLDPKTAQDIMNLFLDIYKETNKTIILISHDMDLIYKYATRIIVMKDSLLVYDGSKERLFKEVDYQEICLEKPRVLQTIDYLNEKMNLDLPYTIYDCDDLLNALSEVIYE